MVSAPRNGTLRELYFLANVSQVNECLTWCGPTSPQGYGALNVPSPILAHRYAWERVNGPIPDGMLIDHICHNPPCVTVDHLRLATKAQNGMNRNGAQKNNASGVRNVVPNRNRWQVQVKKSGKQYYFGTYATVEEAAHAAELARRELFGEYAGRGKKKPA